MMGDKTCFLHISHLFNNSNKLKSCDAKNLVISDKTTFWLDNTVYLYGYLYFVINKTSIDIYIKIEFNDIELKNFTMLS